MHSLKNHSPIKDITVLERLLSSSDKKIDRIFADLMISFVSQIFTIKKKDALVDTKLTKLLLEKEIQGDDLSPEMRRAYKYNLKKLQGQKGVSRLRLYCEDIDSLRDKFIHGSSEIAKSSDPCFIDEIMRISRESLRKIGELQIESIGKESDIAFEEGLLCIKTTYEFLKDGLSPSERQSKTVRSRITEILAGGGENFIDAKKRNIFIGLEMVLIYLDDLLSKKDKKLSLLLGESEKSNDEIQNLNKTLRGYESDARVHEKTIQELNRQLAVKTSNLLATKSSMQKTEKENEGLKEENDRMRKELEELRNFKKQIHEGGLCNDDGRFWQVMALEIEEQYAALSGRYDELQSRSQSDIQKISRLEKTLRDIYENHLDRSTSCKIRCEQNLAECNADDMLSYITYGNCSMDIKQDCADEILKFFDILIEGTSKGASSGMNIQSASQKGKGNGKYANNFINPIINFLKETYNKRGTQAFLEKITNIEWKKLLEDYRGGEINVQSTKKHMVIADVYKQFNNDESANKSLFEALAILPDVLERIDKGNTDLTTLSSNIREALANSNVPKRLYLSLREIIKD